MKTLLMNFIAMLITLNLSAQVPHTLVNGQPANANQINENFTFVNDRIDAANVAIGSSNTEITDMKNYLGMDASNDIHISGSVSASAFYYTSDESLKNNIQSLQNSLNKIRQLRGVTFSWKDNHKQELGLIAQEVERVYPQLVKENSNSIKTVQYGNLIAPLIEAVKELATQNESLKKKLETQQKQTMQLMKLQIQQAMLMDQLLSSDQASSKAGYVVESVEEFREFQGKTAGFSIDQNSTY